MGLCYLRVLTWCPFRLQFYRNGHWPCNWMRSRWATGFRKLDAFADRYCPILKKIEDRQADLQAIYGN